MKAKNITARQFAEEIGIQPSGMSHIMSGRNNPSLDFVSKVIRRYPEIDANWLLLGKGEMYTSAAPQPSPTLFSDEPTVEPAPVPEPQEIVVDAPLPQRDNTDIQEIDAPLRDNPEPQEKAFPLLGNQKIQERNGLIDYAEGGRLERTVESASPREDDGRRLERILFFYSDNTFQEYRPASH